MLTNVYLLDHYSSYLKFSFLEAKHTDMVFATKNDKNNRAKQQAILFTNNAYQVDH